MKRINVTILLFLSALISFAQEFPIDQKVKTGRLDNGLTYYIRNNSFLNGKADIYVVYKVGAILEEDNENGMAHFLEHMAFNGGKNFPGSKAREFLDTTGIEWNANTDLERTAYFFNNIPVEKEGILDKCLLFAYDWSSNLGLDKDVVEKEKGIIREEMRMRGGVDFRIYEALKEELMPDSKYAERNVIGKEETIMNFTVEQLRSFYKKWYRTDMQAIIIVGDIEPDVIEGKITEMFSPISASADKPALPELTLNNEKGETLISIVKDKEVTVPTFDIEFMHEPLSREENGSVDAFSQDYLTEAVITMMNERLEETINGASGHSNEASASYGPFLGIKTKESFNVSLTIGNDKIEESIKQFLSEIFRIRQNGFTNAEYERAKLVITSRYKKALGEIDYTDNSVFAEKYINHFLDGKYTPGAEIEYQALVGLMPQVSLEIINEFTQELMPEEDIAMYLTSTEGNEVPLKAQVLNWYAELNKQKFEPYINKADNEPLLAAIPTSGTITSKTTDPNLETVIFNLSNGAKVVIKQTSPKSNEIMFSATSPGGSSLFPEQYMGNIKLYEEAIDLGGLGNFSKVELQRKLAGKDIELIPTINIMAEGLRGTTNSEYLEEFLQLIYMQFTSPRMDQDAFNALIERKKRMIQSNDPMLAFHNATSRAMYDSERMLPLREEDLQTADYQQIFNWRKDRYSDASDFTFIFVGNIDLDSFEELSKRYLASLPSKSRKESAANVNISIRPGHIEDSFELQMESPQAMIMNLYSTKCELNLKNRIIMEALVEILHSSLMETLRRQEGGIYGMDMEGYISEYPKGETTLRIAFPTEPGKEQHLISLAKQTINNIALHGPNAEDLKKAMNNLANKHDEKRKEKSYWTSFIAAYYAVGLDNISGYKEALNSIVEKDIKSLATKLTKDNLVEVIIKGKR